MVGFFIGWVALTILGIWVMGLTRKSKSAGESDMTDFRFQTLRVLRAMRRGDRAVMELRMADSARFASNARERQEWFSKIADRRHWLDAASVSPVLVPGSWFAGPVGRAMLRNGWCAPLDTPHWVPNLRFYTLAPKGLSELERYELWWRQLSFFQKINAVLCE